MSPLHAASHQILSSVGIFNAHKQRICCLTTHTLEQVCTVLHVVVSIIVVGSLTQNSALLISYEVLIYGWFKVFSRQDEGVVTVGALSQQKLGLKREGTSQLLQQSASSVQGQSGRQRSLNLSAWIIVRDCIMWQHVKKNALLSSPLFSPPADYDRLPSLPEPGPAGSHFLLKESSSFSLSPSASSQGIVWLFLNLT